MADLPQPEGAVALEAAPPERPARRARRALALERKQRPRPEGRGFTARVLSAGEFECCFERERCLADRGTRRFSLVVLQPRRGAGPRPGSHGALAELARQLRERLRSTDVVGQIDVDRLEVLLTDTHSEGAQVVVSWVKQAELRLGLELERSIFVYPSVTDPDMRGNAPGPAEPESATDERGNGPAARRQVAAAAVDQVASTQACPVRDLWPLLGVPTPLWKRTADVAISALALLLLLPLFALVALAIRLDSPGPVIFRQLRAGRGGRPFVFYKFRSMTADAEQQRAALAALNEYDGPVFKIRDDPRKTRVGRLLRRASIDELPQLWNVLLGDISLVGPRSATIDEVDKYERWQRRRLSVSGGITCTWQVSGRNQIPFREWMRLDVRYVACRNFWLDLRLLVLTVPAVISGRGAC